MTKDQAKEEIKKLIAKYEQVKTSGRIKSYTEEETKNSFIKPLFEILDWDFSSKEEVSAEESILSSGRVDYGFYINGRAKLYLEAKPLKADLNNEDYARQAIRYSWNKGVTWAVLTDFEGLKVFNAQLMSKYLSDKLFFNLNYIDYLNRFDQLWLLSKESFLNNELDKEAEKVGKKILKTPVTDSLYKDLNKSREILLKELSIMNEKVDKDLLEEGVQRLLDRLIFIRVAEDRGIESSTLIPLLRAWETSDRKVELYASMVSKFRELDKLYNSNLFSPHPFEAWKDYGDSTKKVINILYGNPGYYEYDFSAIPADILGSVYENYLGFKLSQSQKGLSLNKAAGKRKEQGIYYTPAFIVDYIVRNALKPVLDRCLSVNDLKKIKILDPACGSGSFLVKALEVMVEKYGDFEYKDSEYLRKQILLDNIFGVDLDEQAVEIAKLNLLLNTLKEQGVLPSLDDNIKNGNSLISGSDKELTKYFGKNFRDKKPFNWEEQFPEVFKQGGFDVVIGNPPWGANIDEDVKYLEEKFPDSTKAYKDIYKIFIDKAISLLRKSGSLGFIVPNTFLYQPRYSDVKTIVNSYSHYVINLGEKIFLNVQLPSCILILKKTFGKEDFVVDLTHVDRTILLSKIPESKNMDNIKNKNVIKKTDLVLEDILDFKDAGINYQAFNVGKAKKGESKLSSFLFYQGKKDNDSDREYWKGANINRYFIQESTDQFVRTEYKIFIKDNERVILNKDFFKLKPKLIWRQTASSIIATVDDRGVWFGRSIIGAVIRERYNDINIYYILAILNSRYMDYLYKLKVSETGKVFPQVKLKYLKDLPFAIGSREQKNTLSTLAEKMVSLNKNLAGLSEGSNKWNTIKEEVERTDKKIDQEVYKLYGLTPEEIKIVESSV